MDLKCLGEEDEGELWKQEWSTGRMGTPSVNSHLKSKKGYEW